MPGHRGAHVNVRPACSLLGVVEIVLAESNCAATGPDVNAAHHHHHDHHHGPHHHRPPPRSRPPPPTTTTTVVGATTTTTTSTTTTSTTTTTVAPAATTTTTTTIAPVVTVPPAGSTLPPATTTTTTVAPPPPLPRTGTNTMPMVAIGFLAIALGVIVRRSEGFLPMTESAAMVPQAPPAPIQFHPVDARPSAARRRVRRNPLDAAARDALSAFDDDPNG